jgi:hypothetical protein
MIVNAVHPPVACSPTSSIPALIQLLPAAASSRFRPPPFWPPSCSMPPLRSPLQLRVPPPPVARVPGAPFPTRFALPPPPPPLLCFPFPLQLTRVPPPLPVFRAFPLQLTRVPPPLPVFRAPGIPPPVRPTSPSPPLPKLH